MNLPTVKQLRYLVAVDETRHFGKAADLCYVTQSALSTGIKELESLLGVQLIDRTNKQVTTTQLGKQVATQARLSLQDIESIVELAANDSQSLSGSIRVGVIPTIAPFILPQILPLVRARYPDLFVYLKEDLTENLHKQLMDGELDLLLLAFPYDLSGVETLPLFRDNFVLAHQSKTKIIDPKKFSFNTLNRETLMLLEDGHCMRNHAMAGCNIKRRDNVSRFAASSLFTLIQMVECDLGVTLLPEMAIDSTLLRCTNVVTQPLKGDNYREIGLAWRRGSARSGDYNELGDLIIEACTDAPAPPVAAAVN